MVTALVFIAILVVLIIVHELGHFSVAKAFKIKVEEFGLGIPPKLVSFKKGETHYSLNALPIGGFVKIYGEEGEGKDDQRSFASRKPWVRFMVLFAGVTMNYILAGFLFSMALYIGMPTPATDEEILAGKPINVQMVGISKDSPAEEAGLKMGDIILGFKEDGQLKETKLVKNVQEYTALHEGSNVIMAIKRGKDVREVEVLVRKDHPADQGAIGMTLSDSTIVSFSFFRSFAEGFKYLILMTGEFLTGFFNFFKNLILMRDTGGQVGGPVKIAQMTADVVPLGLAYIFNFAAVLSLTLAVINALPFPALDGGRALFLLLEKIKGSPIKQKTEATIHTVGFALLIILMIALTFNDVVSLIR